MTATLLPWPMATVNTLYAQDIHAPKLTDVTPPVGEPSAPGAGDAAAALPRTVTICQDRALRRCWTEAGTTHCGSDRDTAATVFRVVANDEQRSDLGTALTDCWSQIAP